MTEMDWETDPDVVVRNQDAIAVFVNQRGEIAIRQANWPEDDSLVLFRPEHAEAIARAILNTAGISLQDFVEGAPRVVSSSSAPTSSGALRQKRYRARHARNGDGVTRNGEGDAQPLLPSPKSSEAPCG